MTRRPGPDERGVIISHPRGREEGGGREESVPWGLQAPPRPRAVRALMDSWEQEVPPPPLPLLHPQP